MGWKATMHISRTAAIELIQKRLQDATNEELGNAVESLGYGDREGLDNYGYNFLVNDPDEDAERAEYERLKQKFEG